mmetsp:Transcript_651/g.1560  ORF Transcript_651/g.1560 Transcript_651/m.1560 type:complete len:358 (-) Transcript_651:26-1099(-)
MPDRPPSLLRLGGMLALLIVVAPLSSLYQQYTLWYHRQEMKLHSDPIAQVAAAAQFSRQQNGGEGSRTSDSTGSTTGSSSARTPPGVTNIGSFVVNGEDVDDDISVEELLSLLGVGFGRRRHDQHQLVMQNLGLGFGAAGRSNGIAVGFHIIMPWLLALVFGVIVPAIFALIGRIQTQRRGRKYYDTLSAREKRLFRLIQCFSRYKKTIEDGDLVGVSKVKFTTQDGSAECNDGDSSDERGDADDKEDRLMLKIPHAGTPLLLVLSARYAPIRIIHTKQSNYTLRQVPGTCPICLEQYKVGETVVWSSNSSCRDYFHERCIISWLSKRRGGSDARCPCCRQHFVDDIFRAQAGLNSK